MDVGDVGDAGDAGNAEVREDKAEEGQIRGAGDVGAEMDVVTEGEELLGAVRERTHWMASLQEDERWWETD